MQSSARVFNIGAGTITCNYDRLKEASHYYPATESFVGSNSTLVGATGTQCRKLRGGGFRHYSSGTEDALALGRAGR